jgi:hypothetical protein|tara:strand:+ start:443 stop:1363 length:921 start_codon:yes stop_codon:yes gene_type:complete
MAVYPVSIKGQSTLYIRATKAEITGEMRRLGVKNFKIQNAVPKAMLSKVKLTSLLNIKKPTPSGAGKTAGAPNNPGMKPDLEARSKLPDVIKKKKEAEADKKKKEQSNKRGGSGNQTKKKVTPPVNKKTVDNKQKIQNLAKKVKTRMPNISMSKILDTIRTQIRKRPLTAVAGAGGIGIAIGTIISALKPTKVADATLTGNRTTKDKVSQPKTMPFKSKTKDKGSKPKPSSVSITIATPLPKPKRDKDTSKKKTDKGGSGMMFSLIVGGKGDSKARFKEIAAEKTLEKKLGRRPDKKELLAYLKKN